MEYITTFKTMGIIFTIFTIGFSAIGGLAGMMIANELKLARMYRKFGCKPGAYGLTVAFFLVFNAILAFLPIKIAVIGYWVLGVAFGILAFAGINLRTKTKEFAEVNENWWTRMLMYLVSYFFAIFLPMLWVTAKAEGGKTTWLTWVFLMVNVFVFVLMIIRALMVKRDYSVYFSGYKPPERQKVSELAAKEAVKQKVALKNRRAALQAQLAELEAAEANIPDEEEG